MCNDRLSCYTVIPSFGEAYVTISLVYLPVVMLCVNTVAFVLSVAFACILFYLTYRVNKMYNTTVLRRFKMRLTCIREFVVLCVIHGLLFLSGIIVFTCGIYTTYNYASLDAYFLDTRCSKVIAYARPIAPAPLKDAVQLICEILDTLDVIEEKITSLRDEGLISTDEGMLLARSELENYSDTIEGKLNIICRNGIVLILITILDDGVCALIHRRLIRRAVESYTDVHDVGRSVS